MVCLPDNAFEFHTLHQRCRPIVADLQPPLNITGRGLAVAFDDRNSLREQIAATISAHSGGIEHRAVFVGRLLRRDGLQVFGGALRLEVTNHLFDLFVGNKRAVDAADSPTACHVEHVAFPSSCSAPISPRMVRLSIFDVTWKEMRVGKFALIVPVMTSTDGRWVARITCKPAARAICASRCTAPSISLPATIIRSAISSTMMTI